MSSITGRSRPVQQIPEPSRFWIGYSPRNWKGTERPWTDLANAKLEGFQRRGPIGIPEIESEGLDNLFYLPPVAPEMHSERQRVIDDLHQVRVPVLLQADPREDDLPQNCHVVYDLLHPLLEGDLEVFFKLPEGCTVVWPLISGLTDPPEICDEGCDLLSARGVRCVQPVVVELTPFIKRRLAEGRDEDVYDSLFHSDPMSEREFARIAYRYGLNPFMTRPPIAGTPKFVSNYQIAGVLAMIAELWLRLDRPTGQGQAILRAARGAERTHHHLAALAEEKNLKVLNWLDTGSQDLIRELVETGSVDLQQELFEEYVGKRSATRRQDDDEDGDVDDDAMPDDFDPDDSDDDDTDDDD